MVMNQEEPVTPEARLSVFRSALIKGMRLAYRKDEYDTVIARLKRVMSATGTTNHSQALLRLLDHYEVCVMNGRQP